MKAPMHRRLVMQCLAMALWWSGRAAAQSSEADFIAGTVVKIDAERGTVLLRHAAIAHLHLPAATTSFRYFHPSLITRIKDNDLVRFRADRYDGGLRLLAVVPMGPASAR